MNEYWRHMPPWFVLFFFAFLCTHTSYSSSTSLVFPSTGWRRLPLWVVLCFSPFFSTSVSFTSSSLPFICVAYSVLAMGAGAGDATIPCRFGVVGLSVFTFVPEQLLQL